MSVVIRLKREGRRNLPSYRIHVVDGRTARDGASIEKLGFYDPLAKDPEKTLQFDRERAEHWLKQGARVSPTVASIFRRHKLLEGTPVAAPRERPGRKRKTKTQERRLAAKQARTERKAARPAHRRKPKAAEAKKG